MEAIMANTPITERQKFWRDHVLAAAAFVFTNGKPRWQSVVCWMAKMWKNQCLLTLLS